MELAFAAHRVGYTSRGALEQLDKTRTGIDPNDASAARDDRKYSLAHRTSGTSPNLRNQPQPRCCPFCPSRDRHALRAKVPSIRAPSQGNLTGCGKSRFFAMRESCQRV